VILDELYTKYGTPDDEKLTLPKNVMLVTPDRNFDIAPYLQDIGISNYEVCSTWPKGDLPLLNEVLAVQPEIVVQIGEKVSRKFPFVGQGEKIGDKLKERVRNVITDNFVNLHHHDEFSMRDGLGTVDQLMHLLKHQRRSFCCITNHGGIGGWVKQYSACKKLGVKSIFGMEAYTSEYRGDDPDLKRQHRSANHLLLLAGTEEGFYNLIRIHNDAQLNGFYYSPRCNREAFEKWGKGIIGSSACIIGEIAKLLKADEWQKAIEVYQFYDSVFDKFYLELPLIEYSEQLEVNKKLVQLASEVNAQLILTCDSHYLTPDQADTHDILMLIRDGKTMRDKIEKPEEVWQFETKNLFYRTGAEMQNIWETGWRANEEGEEKVYKYKDSVFTEDIFADAMENTRQIALTCEEIELDSKPKLPKMSQNSKNILVSNVKDGFKKRQLKGKEYVDRVNYELKVITKLGWSDYFLIVEKIIKDAIEEFDEWVIGYGRGSAAGSLVSYCLGITDIDPIEMGLLFERFLDEDRPDPPDIDCDFDPRARDTIKRRIVESFGKDKTCSIGTYSTYKTRAVILDVARALGYDVHAANNITKEMDTLTKVDAETEDEALRLDKASFDELCNHYPKLKKYFDTYPEVKRHAEILRNQIKNMSSHAGGVIISDLNLQDRIPVFEDKHGRVVSTWAEGLATHELSQVGLVKFDILGLKNLSIISDCLKFIEETTGERIKRKDIPIDDREAIKFGAKQDLVGIFQFENPATKPIADDVRMESLNDISAVTSLIRPGPKDMGMHKEYARRKNGAPYTIPNAIKDLLKDTYGILTYQEQAQRIAQVLSGFSPIESNQLRYAISKKDKLDLANMRVKFIKGARSKVKQGEITDKEVNDIWDQIESFGGYAFNLAHAASYGSITAVEFWLKYHYPTEFITALLNNTDPAKKKFSAGKLIVEYINYARRKKIQVLPPCINESKEGFSIKDGNIRFALGHIKNVGTSASLIEEGAPYKNMEDFFSRQNKRKVNKRVMESLIASGAFNCFGTKNDVFFEYYKLRKSKKEEVIEKEESEWEEREREIVGLCLSKEPIADTYSDLIREKEWYKISDVTNKKKKLYAFGRIEQYERKISKAGNEMYVVTLSDDISTLSFYVFKKSMTNFAQKIKKGDIAAIPLDRFPDGDMRFFNGYKEPIIIKT